jgi:hypothetical protein
MKLWEMQANVNVSDLTCAARNKEVNNRQRNAGGLGAHGKRAIFDAIQTKQST